MELTWKPNFITRHKISSGFNLNRRFKYFRASSSGYIKKPKVRAYVFEKYNGKCAYCQSSEELEIDHIISVYDCFKQGKIEFCNTIENLQLLCKTCNAKKS